MNQRLGFRAFCARFIPFFALFFIFSSCAGAPQSKQGKPQARLEGKTSGESGAEAGRKVGTDSVKPIEEASPGGRKDSSPILRTEDKGRDSDSLSGGAGSADKKEDATIKPDSSKIGATKNGAVATAEVELAPDVGAKDPESYGDAGGASPLDDAARPRPSTAELPKKETPSESGLKAGYSDDNDQFNYFVKFLEQYGTQVESYPLNIGERIILTVKDSAGKPVSNAEVLVQSGDKTLASGKTYASGIFHIFPLEYPRSSYRLSLSYGGEKKFLDIKRDGPRNLELRLDKPRAAIKEVPLDILFILDTTGSMGEEIERLRATIEIINANVSAVSPKPRVRFGLVLYRDKDDSYLTKLVPFTSDMDAFQRELDDIDADGGGDTPEDLQSALSDALTKMDWNRDGLRLAYIITDAEPHLDYGQTYTYAQAARDAKAKGIKLYSVGTGGLPLQGEYVLRQISQYSAARYIFLTYGEKGESSGGTEASVSHHTGSNFQTDKLEAIIIRFTREELAYLSDQPLLADDPYFDARKIKDEDRDATLARLFRDAIKNLVDYSTFAVGKESKAVLSPIGLSESDSSPELKRQAEYFSEALLLETLRSRPFTIVDRRDLQKILEEQELQYSALIDDKTAVKIGSLLGSELMVAGRLYLKDGKYEIFLKLLRVETGEILSVSKAKLAKELGL